MESSGEHRLLFHGDMGGRNVNLWDSYEDVNNLCLGIRTLPNVAVKPYGADADDGIFLQHLSLVPEPEHGSVHDPTLSLGRFRVMLPVFGVVPLLQQYRRNVLQVLNAMT